MIKENKPFEAVIVKGYLPVTTSEAFEIPQLFPSLVSLYSVGGCCFNLIR